MIDATANAYEELNKQCGFNPSNKLDEFIYLAELQTSQNVNIMYNVDRAIVDVRDKNWICFC